MSEPFWKKGIRFQCQGSGKCCASRGQYGFVYMNLEDRQRMAKVLKLTTQEFTHRYCAKTDGFFHLKNPKEAVNCLFLKDNQCSVYEGRPTQCRTWPFWPENMKAKNWNRDVVAFCPGVDKGQVQSADKIEKEMKRQVEAEAKLHSEAEQSSVMNRD